MDGKVYDVPEVLAALEAAVAEKGADYVYTNDKGRKADGVTICTYVHHRNTDNPVPGCIVGDVYHRLTGELVPYRNEHHSPVDSDAHWPFTSEAAALLSSVQYHQDGGKPWRRAVAEARQSAGV